MLNVMSKSQHKVLFNLSYDIFQVRLSNGYITAIREEDIIQQAAVNYVDLPTYHIQCSQVFGFNKSF